MIHAPDNIEYFEDILEDEHRTVVMVAADWCAPCQRTKPGFEELDSERDIECFVMVDLDECPELAAHLRIRSVPTIIFFEGGEEVGRRQSGTKAELEQSFNEFFK